MVQEGAGPIRRQIDFTQIRFIDSTEEGQPAGDFFRTIGVEFYDEPTLEAHQDNLLANGDLSLSEDSDVELERAPTVWENNSMEPQTSVSVPLPYRVTNFVLQVLYDKSAEEKNILETACFTLSHIKGNCIVIRRNADFTLEIFTNSNTQKRSSASAPSSAPSSHGPSGNLVQA